mmetsp:Transcript_12329/g.41709  ORF Transcript_12329/g.41709 Transcript_12329/m.41709 type:complete len:216 (+) Transcript_12329:191-838(+)
MITSGGTQFTRSSYSISRAWRSACGDCLLTRSFASWVTYTSQSGACTTWSAVKGYCCALHASSMSSARRRLRLDVLATRSTSSWGAVRPSLRRTLLSTADTSWRLGAATRMPRQRLRSGSMMRDGDVQQRMRRHDWEYFSMVRRSPAWACSVSRSTSVRITTLYAGFPAAPSLPPGALMPPSAVTRGLLDAISLMSSCTTTRSYVPASAGLHSMW